MFTFRKTGRAFGALLALTLAGASSARAADLVDTAAANGSFKTLVAAVKAADLVETLKGKGPYTLFAPTDAAFARLPAGTVENLLKPENKKKLVALLTYHVVPGKVTAADALGLKSGAQVATVNGARVRITHGKAGGVRVNGAKVVTPDVAADNGVIHVIDAVIMPPADR